MEFLKSLFKAIIAAKNLTVNVVSIIFAILFFGGLLYSILSELARTGILDFLFYIFRIIFFIFIFFQWVSRRRKY
jgi:NADH:ubiquinone oxidoreductase subunit H